MPLAVNWIFTYVGVNDHLNAFNRPKLIKQLAHFLLGGVGVQAENSNAATCLRMILEERRVRISNKHYVGI